MQHMPNNLHWKSQSVIAGKLFFSYRTVFGLAQGLLDSKTSHLNCLYKAPEKKQWPYVFASCVLSLSSVLEKGSYRCIVILAH